MDLVREFLMRSLSAAGGVVEEAPGGLEALLPAHVAARLGLAEELRIQLDSTPASAGAADGRLGSPFLERLVAARLENAPFAAVALPAELPRSLSPNLPALLNAVRAGDAEAARTPARFLATELRLVLQGEELRSTLHSLTVRLEDGARVRTFRVGDSYPVATAPLDDRERRNAVQAIGSWIRREGPGVLSSALETLRRRALRDLERMAEFYASLDVEMVKAAERARSPEERSRRLAKRAALPTDLAQRREQLRARMRPRLAARMVAATLIETEVERFVIPVRRRTNEGKVTVVCRAADGAFEGPRCAGCGIQTLRFFLCDERLHVLCEACGQAGRLDAARCPACCRRDPHPLVISVEDPTARFGLAGPLDQ
jgi:hypothetical protein